MNAVYLLAVLVVAGYGITWMIGGPQTANRYLRFVLRGAARAALWGIGLIFRFTGWLLNELGMAGSRLLSSAGRRLPQFFR